MTQLHELKPAHLHLLCDLLAATPHSDAGVDPLPFRASHYDNIKDIDWLESVGYIRKEQDRYHVSLTAIVQMPDARAVRLMRDSEVLFSELKRHYIRVQRESAKVSDLVAATGIELAAVKEILYFMVEGRWYGGGSTSFFTNPDPVVLPTEAILGYATFGDVVAQLRSWQASRISGRHMAPSSALLDFSAAATMSPGSLPKQVREKPDWLNDLPPSVKPLMDEIYAALSAQLRALPAMGVRAVIDLVCVELVGDIGTFNEKLKKLAAAGHILERERPVLATVIEAGNASAHRGHLPANEDLGVLLDILEQLLHRQYIQSEVAKRIGANTPPRPPKQEKKE